MTPRDSAPDPDVALAIRPATPADMPAVGRLGARLVALHHELDAQRFIAASPRTEQGYASWLRSQLASREVVILVAERDGDVLGYTYAGIEGFDYMSLRGPAGVLHDIIVDPAVRGQGIGRRLLEATIQALRVLGAPRVVLSTAARNVDAQRMFERAGFRPTMVEMTREVADDVR